MLSVIITIHTSKKQKKEVISHFVLIDIGNVTQF